MQFSLWLLLRVGLVSVSTALLNRLLKLPLGESLTVSFGAYCLYCLFQFEREMRVFYQNQTRVRLAWMMGFGWGPGMAAAVCAASTIYMFAALTERFVPSEQVRSGIMLGGSLLSLYLCYRAFKLIGRLK